MKIQLFCLPYAGGTATVFRELNKFLDSEIELITLEYAGHGNRRKEPFYESFQNMVLDIRKQIDEKRVQGYPYGILGYSMGSLVLYELCRLMQVENLELPEYLFFSAHESPEIPFPGKDYSILSDEDFVEALIKFGGTSEQMRTNQRMRNLFLPPVRADYKLLHDFSYKKCKYKFQSNGTIFYAEEDTPYENVKGWQNYFEEECNFVKLGNSHFFIKNHSKDLARVIEETLSDILKETTHD